MKFISYILLTLLITISFSSVGQTKPDTPFFLPKDFHQRKVQPLPNTQKQLTKIKKANKQKRAYNRALAILNIGLKEQKEVNLFKTDDNDESNKTIIAVPTNRTKEQEDTDYIQYEYDADNIYQKSFNRYKEDIENIRQGKPIYNKYLMNTILLMDGRKRILK